MTNRIECASEVDISDNDISSTRKIVQSLRDSNKLLVVERSFMKPCCCLEIRLFPSRKSVRSLTIRDSKILLQQHVSEMGR